MEKGFIQKVLIVAAIAFAGILIFLGLSAALHLLLLVFGGVLISIYFRKLSEILTDRSKLKMWHSLTIVITGTLLAIAALIWGLGAKINEQTQDLKGQLPSLSQSVSEKLGKSSAGRRLMEQGERLQTQGEENSQPMVGAITTFFTSTFGALGDLYIVIIISIYFTATPSLYKKSIVQLFPASKRKKTEDTMEDLYHTLGKWIIGQLIAMVIIAVATGVGLSIMGVPYALLFALIAGALNFIPNFGPLIAMIPAALVALTVSPGLALGVIILYVIIQNIEGEFITPLIQQKMVALPPAYIILFQVFMGIIAGGIGVIMATPLLSVIMRLIQKVYVAQVANKE